jgi:type 1 fimbriae regulatory protein FimB/type 1 fimbriae regulatory protein FimE
MSKVVPLRQPEVARPATLNGKVPPKRQRNKELRSREYLIADEIDRLIAAAGRVGRHRHRDKTMILLA